MATLKNWFLCYINVLLTTVILSGQNFEKLASQCNAGNEKACVKLVQIAKTHTKPEIRCSAIEKLNDQAVLTEIAKNDADNSVRIAAVERLDDQAILTEIAKKDANYKVRKSAVEKLVDEAELVEIARKDDNKDVARSAMDRVTEQQYLGEIVKPEIHIIQIIEGDSSKVVRTIIVPKYEDIRSKALDKIRDQKLLAEISQIEVGMNFQTYQYYETGGVPIRNFRDVAVLKIRDTLLLNELADNANDIRVQMFSIISLALGPGWQYLPCCPIDYGQERRNKRIAKIAELDPSKRIAAIEEIDNVKLIELVSTKDREQSVRDAAKKRLEKIRKQ